MALPEECPDAKRFFPVDWNWTIPPEDGKQYTSEQMQLVQRILRTKDGAPRSGVWTKTNDGERQEITGGE